jgi:hypothetical protein
MTYHASPFSCYSFSVSLPKNTIYHQTIGIITTIVDVHFPYSHNTGTSIGTSRTIIEIVPVPGASPKSTIGPIVFFTDLGKAPVPGTTW